MRFFFRFAREANVNLDHRHQLVPLLEVSFSLGERLIGRLPLLQTRQDDRDRFQHVFSRKVTKKAPINLFVSMPNVRDARAFAEKCVRLHEKSH